MATLPLANVLSAVAVTLLCLIFLMLPSERCRTRTVVDAAGARPKSLAPLAFGSISPMMSPPPPPVAAAESDGRRLGCSQRHVARLLAIGIITAPTHHERRVWIRQKLRTSDARCRGIRIYFVLGAQNKMTRAQRRAIRFEERVHADIIFVRARDWVPHAVAEKSLAWWQYAAAHLPRFKWYMKTDDDSLAHLPRLERDLEAMDRMGRSHYYYGVMTWRTWIPFYAEADAACGDRGDDGPSLSGPSSRLKRLVAARADSGVCAAAIGPFPFADGSLQILSADLMCVAAAAARPAHPGP